MAHKAISSTKAQKPNQALQSVSFSGNRTLDGKRRSQKQLLQSDDVHPTELFPMDAVFADNEAPERLCCINW